MSVEGTYRPVRSASFGSFEVDFRAGELSKQGRRIRLQDQPLHVLSALLEHPGQVVTREELRQRLWPGDTFVDFDHGLNNAINRLRDVLGDSAETPTYIETIPRRGYRFIAPVQTASAVPARAGSPTHEAPTAPAEATATAPVDATLSLRAVGGPVSATVAERAQLETSRIRRVMGAVAVGLAGVLIMVLVGLAVWPRDRQPAQAQRVTASTNPQAVEQYLRAKPYFGVGKAEDNEAAITRLEKAVALDPSFAAAYAALGNAYRMRSTDLEPHNPEWEEKAFAAVQRALQLDPSLTEGYVVRARLLWTPRNHWAHERAVQEFRRALTLDANLSEAHHHLGDIYNHVGLLDRAVDELQKAVALDPFNTAARFRIGVNLLYRGRYDESLTALRDAQRYNPGLWTFQTSFALFQLGRRQEARERIAEFLRDESRRDAGGLLASIQGLLAAADGDAGAAERSVREAMGRGQGYSHFHHTEYVVAATYARLGKPELAVKHLQRAADNGFPCYALFEQDTNFDGLRGHPPFAEFMAKQKKQWERFKATL
jgi:DNA-binding winged helix-turn-helix (wHTH) protein/tetratricopeptide (TPR) repeat protein